MVRAAAKNHANVAIVIVAGALRRGARRARRSRAASPTRSAAPWRSRPSPTRPPTTPGSRPSCRGRFALAGLDLPAEPGLPGADDPYPPDADDLAREGRDAALRREPAPAGGPLPAPGHDRRGRAVRRRARPPLQGKALSYNNVLDAAAAAALGRALRGPGVVIVKHTNPCGAAERTTLAEAWAAALEADPVSAFGGVVALTRPGDRRVAEQLDSIFLEIVVAPGVRRRTRSRSWPGSRTCASWSTRRSRTTPPPGAVEPTGSIRTAGGAYLVGAPDAAERRPDDLDRRDPARPERRRAARPRPRLAPRPRRHLERDRAREGPPARRDGQRPDVAGRCRSAGRRQGPRDARRRRRREAPSCASDAFFPFPDAVEVCLAAGVTAFVQPGGSMRDADAVAVVDAAGGAMLVTGVRHFRH